MKISKDDLFYIFDCADDPDQHVQWGLDMDDIKNALIEDDLEIEGYIRADHFRDAAKMVNEWTKFDTEDPKTLLEKFERVLFSMDGVIMCGTIQDILTAKWRGAEQIYWRPLPKPPVESNCE